MFRIYKRLRVAVERRGKNDGDELRAQDSRSLPPKPGLDVARDRAAQHLKGYYARYLSS